MVVLFFSLEFKLVFEFDLLIVLAGLDAATGSEVDDNEEEDEVASATKYYHK